MPKYYCDYCDVYLTHDSASVRKAHNSGRNHVTNVRDWYASLWSNEAQDRIDEITRKYDANNAQPQVPRQIPGSTNPMLRMPMPPMPQGGGSFNQPFHPMGPNGTSGAPPMPPMHGNMPPPFVRHPMPHGNVN